MLIFNSDSNIEFNDLLDIVYQLNNRSKNSINMRFVKYIIINKTVTSLIDNYGIRHTLLNKNYHINITDLTDSKSFKLRPIIRSDVIYNIVPN
jgi:hypothetical protein